MKAGTSERGHAGTLGPRIEGPRAALGDRPGVGREVGVAGEEGRPHRQDPRADGRRRRRSVGRHRRARGGGQRARLRRRQRGVRRHERGRRERLDDCSRRARGARRPAARRRAGRARPRR